ncbi:type VI secretion system lysozyme-like protein [Skermanella aerolata]|uniref:type VI secretion system baseplate subunit TssE n=1 Tax=Skermanella aerolata TaxID=393310 RepID=UPI003D2405CD
MPDRASAERLQPALLDRLADTLGRTASALAEARQRLDAALGPQHRAAVGDLLTNDRLPTLVPENIFTGLDPEIMALVTRVLELERTRRAELMRDAGISTQQLRRSVLRNLRHLLAATHLEQADGGSLLADYPTIRDSVVNFGIPPLAGQLRTPAGLEQLARGLEQAVNRFEPRIRYASVTVGDREQNGERDSNIPVAFVLRGELWGYPVHEALQVRTVLDPIEARLTLERGALPPSEAGAS